MLFFDLSLDFDGILFLGWGIVDWQSGLIEWGELEFSDLISLIIIEYYTIYKDNYLIKLF